MRCEIHGYLDLWFNDFDLETIFILAIQIHTFLIQVNVVFQIFKGLSQENRQKVTIVAGDIQLPDLGLTNFDRRNLADTVDIVFHVAATIK